MLNEVNFVKDYQKDSYTKKKFIKKRKDDKNIFTTFKRHS
jgi:hypothetical protein